MRKNNNNNNNKNNNTRNNNNNNDNNSNKGNGRNTNSLDLLSGFFSNQIQKIPNYMAPKKTRIPQTNGNNQYQQNLYIKFNNNNKENKKEVRN